MDNNKVLFVCQDYTHTNEGLSVVTKRNLRLLQRCGYEIDQIMIKAPSVFTKLKNILLHESYGYTSAVSKEIKASLNKEYIFVFFDRSIFGPLVKLFSERKVRTICFFHNVEAHLAKSRLQLTKNPLYRLLYYNLCWNERLSAKYSDTIIAISERDQMELREKYKLKKVTLMPTSFAPAPHYCLQNKTVDDNSFCLFVGSNFFANQEGIKWFINEVAPNVYCNIKIVGSICNYLVDKHLPQNVKLEGFVDDLNDIYAKAMCVVSPIFSGSGLKTKSIEALRYGKTIFGTDEAFAGIKPVLFDKIGKLCNTKEEFIEAINTYSKRPVLLNDGSLDVFNQYFSDEVAYLTLKGIIS